jgi:tetratricopeptide (TPR) repeat protein
MRRRTWAFPLAIAASAMFAIEARAGDWEACKNENPDVSIFGCSAIIDAGTDPTEDIANAHYLRGNAYYRKTEFGRAIADYGKVIALDPDFANAYVLRGAAHEQQGRKQKAAADYRKALALRPGNKTATQGLQRLSSGTAETSAGESSFRIFANTDFAGALLKKLPAGSAADCEAKCQARKACAAFTFNVWNAACFLKSEVTAALLEPSSVSGLPAGVAAPPRSTAAKSMVRYRGRVFPGEPASAGASASFVTCEARCEDDPHCVAFSYVKEGSICRQFARAGEYSRDRGIDSGVKRQVGQ